MAILGRLNKNLKILKRTFKAGQKYGYGKASFKYKRQMKSMGKQKKISKRLLLLISGGSALTGLYGGFKLGRIGHDDSDIRTIKRKIRSLQRSK